MTAPHTASSRTGDELRLPAGRSARWGNFALVSASVIVSLAIIEFGYRIYAGLPILNFKDWRTEQAMINKIGDRAVLDPVLGWTLKPWHKSAGHTTMDHGVRRNFSETSIRTGGVLAVGDSFTEGWQVSDSESWPALLEKAIGVPVVNAGVGGYGTDQIVLRAEQLRPIVRPHILIVGFLDLDIYRTGHSYFGAPKPHFTIENGELRYHRPEIREPRLQPGLMWSLRHVVRDMLGRFAIADFLLGAARAQFLVLDRRSLPVACGQQRPGRRYLRVARAPQASDRGRWHLDGAVHAARCIGAARRLAADRERTARGRMRVARSHHGRRSVSFAALGDRRRPQPHRRILFSDRT